MSTDLKINKSKGMDDHAIQFEIRKLQESISSIETNISDIKTEYDKQMRELAEETNYDPWFYAAIGFSAVWFLYKLFSASLVIIFSSFVLLIFLCCMFYVYKKFLHKETRVIEIKEEYEKNLLEQEKLLAERREALSQYER